MNIGMQQTYLICAFRLLGYIPRSGIVESYKSNYWFFNNVHIIFKKAIPVSIPTARDFLSPCIYISTSCSLSFVMYASLYVVRYLIVVLICIFMMNNNVQHFLCAFCPSLFFLWWNVYFFSSFFEWVYISFTNLY